MASNCIGIAPHALQRLVKNGVRLHAIVAHLGLMHASRVRQVERIAAFVAAELKTYSELVRRSGAKAD